MSQRKEERGDIKRIRSRFNLILHRTNQMSSRVGASTQPGLASRIDDPDESDNNAEVLPSKTKTINKSKLRTGNQLPYATTKVQTGYRAQAMTTPVQILDTAYPYCTLATSLGGQHVQPQNN
jgi:hypothetical protein